MISALRPVFVLCLLVVCLVERAFAQVRGARPITDVPTEFAEPFSSVRRLVEPRDGRLIVHDEKEWRFGVLDFARGLFTDVARRGAGPLECRSVWRFVRIAGDSILLWDSSNVLRQTHMDRR